MNSPDPIKETWVKPQRVGCPSDASDLLWELHPVWAGDGPWGCTCPQMTGQGCGGAWRSGIRGQLTSTPALLNFLSHPLSPHPWERDVSM